MHTLIVTAWSGLLIKIKIPRKGKTSSLRIGKQIFNMRCQAGCFAKQRDITISTISKAVQKNHGCRVNTSGIQFCTLQHLGYSAETIGTLVMEQFEQDFKHKSGENNRLLKMYPKYLGVLRVESNVRCALFLLNVFSRRTLQCNQSLAGQESFCNCFLWA